MLKEYISNHIDLLQRRQILCKTMLKTNIYLKQKNFKSIKMLNLSLKQLRLVAKNSGIEAYKSMSKNRLLSMLKTPELIKEQELSKT